MTIIEAASQGAPSLVHGGGAVGATDLLSGERQEVFLTDMGTDAATLARHLETEVLADAARLLRVARNAASAAREWDEAANARALMEVVRAATGI